MGNLIFMLQLYTHSWLMRVWLYAAYALREPTHIVGLLKYKMWHCIDAFLIRRLKWTVRGRRVINVVLNEREEYNSVHRVVRVQSICKNNPQANSTRLNVDLYAFNSYTELHTL